MKSVVIFKNDRIGDLFTSTFAINRILKKHNKDKDRVKKLISFVKKKGGVEYAEKIMLSYKSKALKVILEFPKNDFRKSLEFMLDYVIERKY